MSTKDQLISGRLNQVVVCLAEGLTAKQIARKFGISHYTVNSYIQQARDEAGAKTAAALVATAIRSGWIQ